MNALWYDGNVVILYITTALFLFTENGYINRHRDLFEFTDGFSSTSTEVMLKNVDRTDRSALLTHEPRINYKRFTIQEISPVF